MAQLEIACFTVESAIIAQENGADRVELCAEMNLGGTTPDYEAVKFVREKLTIDLNVMIRPRGGNFVYSVAELEQMQSEILHFKKLHVNAFVFGILNEDTTVNVLQNKMLVDLAQPFPCTFHRAFDEVSNPLDALEQVIDCGFTTILTSGQQPNVLEGKDCLAELVKAAKNRIVIMPGGGLRSSNIDTIRQGTKAVFYHSSAITDGGDTPNPHEILALKAKLK